MIVNRYTGGALAMLAALGAPANAQDYTMRVSVPSASSEFVCRGIMTEWTARIEAESGGRIRTQLFCDSTLSQVGDTVNRVAAGVAEAGWDLPNVYGARFAHYGVVGVPGIVDNAETAASALWSLYEDGTFPPIPGIRLAHVQIQNTVAFWTREPLADPTALNGIRVISGSALRGLTTSLLGGVPLSLRVPEYYQALARGAADGLMTNFAAVAGYRYFEHAPNGYTAPWGAGITFSFINAAWYESLPDDLKAVIDNNTGDATSVWLTQLFIDYESRRLAELLEAEEVRVTALTDAHLSAIQPVFQTVADHWVSSTENGQTYLDAFTQAYAARE